ncbi:MAG: methyltransferase domain-containing protein [Candidatus Diapherotrites archaeon]
MFREPCLVCRSSNLSRIMDLGMHPFADTFILKSRLSESEPVYPLLLDLCLDCSQVQAACVTNPDERYSLYDYSYTSSNSKFATDHWEEYAEEVTKKINLEKDSFIVEIGSNDGFLSEQFLKKGYRVLGVDCSQYMADLAQKRGVETIVGLFNLETAKKIKEKYGKAKLIIANNVFNHSDDPLDFAKGVAELLEYNGTFVSEQPYWFISVKSGKFDQIYHEHVSYFSAKSISELMKRVGLGVWDMQNVDYHGGSLRTFAKKEENVYGVSAEQAKMIKLEEEFGLFNPETYKRFMVSILRQKNELLSTIYNIKQKEIPIIAIGAAAKGNTFLNFYNLSSDVINYVTDASPHKQGKYTPLTRIPIVGDEIFKNYSEVYALILSWNISDSLKIILQQINPKIKFLSLPEMR